MVYRATRAADGAEVAVKTVVPASGVSPRQVDRFIREAQILARLSHPNIVKFHEVGEAGGIVFLVMELVAGPTAEAIVRDKGPMEVRAAVRLTCLLLAGLEHAHSQGYVHRDVSRATSDRRSGGSGQSSWPTSGWPGVRVEPAERADDAGDIGGTPAFMAPEQVTHYRDARRRPVPAVRPCTDSAAATLTTPRWSRSSYRRPNRRCRSEPGARCPTAWRQ